MEDTKQRQEPMVMIIGAGIGGLMLGALLERANIPYHIYERADKIRPLGKKNTPLTDTSPRHGFRHCVLTSFHFILFLSLRRVRHGFRKHRFLCV
jgi:phytoene dehydrogenase-like protein